MYPLLLVDWTALDVSDVDDSLVAAFGNVSNLELLLWTVVLGAAAMDIVVTTYGLSAGFVERNPAIRPAIEALGPAALVLAKAAAVGFALVVRHVWPQSALVVPVALAVPWLLATGISLAVVLSA
jgi:hypothetical protein